MAKNLPKARPLAPLPPLLFPAKDRATARWMTHLRKARKIRQIGPRLYTSVPRSEEKAAVRAGWAEIVSELFPDAVLSHRSALEFRPTEDGNLYLTSSTHRKIEYPGLTLHFLRGPNAQFDDQPFLGFHSSSQARAFLENLGSSKKTAQRSLGMPALEERLESILQANGEEKLNAIRDRAREIAKEFGWNSEFRKLDGIIGALLGTRSGKHIVAPGARARIIGKPYDRGRMALFDSLFSELLSQPLPERKNKFIDASNVKNKAFFEAYFSNYIEGTIFEIEEAEEIVFEGKIPAKRAADGHDIASTFAIVSDPNLMRHTPTAGEDLLAILQARHQVLMQAREENLPGHFKVKASRAGDTHFVTPDLVEGTLLEGYKRYRDLPPGLPRAIFVMFLVAEVHPFADGNGRIARILMNAELVSQSLSTIIIPNVYRDSYLQALRSLTRRSRPGPLIKMLNLAQGFSTIDYGNFPAALRYMRDHNWFRDSDEATIRL